MADIVPALNEAIESTFQTRMVGDKRIMRLGRRIRDGTATLVDAHRYAQYTGENMSKALLANLTEDNLPDGILYYNIATRTVTPSLMTGHRLVNEIAKQIQGIIDEKEGIGLSSVEATFPEARVRGLIDKMTQYDGDYEKSAAWLKEPIVNNVEAFFDDYIKANADFRHSVGLVTTIVRVAEPNCCQWCADLAGTYEYNNEPKEVYQRHEFCRCDVTYHSDKRSQNVWTKEEWAPTEDELKARREAHVEIMSAAERQRQIEGRR